jgi:hypothetical protein
MPPDESRSRQSIAFERAIADLAALHPAMMISDRERDEMVDAILSLTGAGQSDPESLARYAVARCVGIRAGSSRLKELAD